MYSQKRKRIEKTQNVILFDGNVPLAYNSQNSHQIATEVTDGDDDTFALNDIIEELAEGKYGSVTKECEELHAKFTQLKNYFLRSRPLVPSLLDNADISACIDTDALGLGPVNGQSSPHFKITPVESNVADNSKAIIAIDSAKDDGYYADYYSYTKGAAVNEPIILIDSDDEAEEFLATDVVTGDTKAITSSVFDADHLLSIPPTEGGKLETLLKIRDKKPERDDGENNRTEEKKKNEFPACADAKCATDVLSNLQNGYDSVSLSDPEDEFDEENGQEHACDRKESHVLEALWKEMSFAIEYSKGKVSNDAADMMVEERGEDCEHEFLIEDNIGLVCQNCGFIKKSIMTIFDYQWRKGSQTSKTYTHWLQKLNDVGEDINLPCAVNSFEDDLSEAKLSIHPRHMKQMMPHQIEGFNFLMKNLVGQKPGGCILAHAPGSGKTFMLISFIQSFLACIPSARPLIVLPKGLLTNWKKQFELWQVEDIQLYDLYSVKAEGRSKQLEVLTLWEGNKSVLFVGYKQFSSIICDVKDKVGAACQERLLTVPTLLILDEGHTPRNEDTNVLSTLAKVETPRKVVLSGTLYQNRVKEVFNILNLVRPKFLKMESSRAIMRRILGGMHASGGRRSVKADMQLAFFELVEETLLNDDDSAARVRVIRDLREMTKDVLHYYKGDMLEDLPGLDDFTVMLKLTNMQSNILTDMEGYHKFKEKAVRSAVYLHPCLKRFAVHASREKSMKVTNEQIDQLIESIDVKDGVKAKFLLNIISMADAAGERVLVFSQYILPLRFFERLVARMKGWQSGKEIFVISGDTRTEEREWAMGQFNSSPDAKVFFGSIKACGEGISLVGASRVVILDVHLNPSVSTQAIARAFRPGQTKKVFAYRLVTADSMEEKNHCLCFRKELIAKMWFEWGEHCGHGEFELENVLLEDCGDSFLTHPQSVVDIKALYKR